MRLKKLELLIHSTHQGLLFIRCALFQQDISKVRVGTLSPSGVETLRNINEFLGLNFDIRPGTTTWTLMLKCIGSGLIKLSRKLSWFITIIVVVFVNTISFTVL
ncbi:putative RNA 3'-terminal phosphate cyclase-like protein [Cardamine amara subsp. amara]|uniref:RNA 3'-terminal phosphate cyclase-like protein n=1 Tax=Cardamine amara subsp. amara TaxID=228776 RepID=A0ABD1C4I8_CARAN